MPRGGRRAGSGRRRNQAEQAPNKSLATEILASLGKEPAEGHKPKGGADCKCERCLWKRDAEQPGTEGQWARKYLWDRRDGKPVQTVNHLHDQPNEMHHTVSFFEVIEKARKRAQQR